MEVGCGLFKCCWFENFKSSLTGVCQQEQSEQQHGPTAVSGLVRKGGGWVFAGVDACWLVPEDVIMAMKLSNLMLSRLEIQRVKHCYFLVLNLKRSHDKKEGQRVALLAC